MEKPLSILSLEAAYKRVVETAAHRIVEPLAAFSKKETVGGALVLSSDEVIEAPIVTTEGIDNYVFIGYKSRAERLNIRFSGSGNFCFIGAHGYVSGDLHVTGNNNSIFIGSYTTVSNFVVHQTGDEGSFVVGDRCMFSARIFTGNTDGCAIFDVTNGARLNPNLDTSIGDQVWLAREVSIARGTTIGNGVAVGQGSHISGVLTPNSVYAGAPAKRLREGVIWSRSDLATMDEDRNSSRARKYHQLTTALASRIAAFAAADDTGKS